MGMFRNEILGMFHNGICLCNEFVEALMKHDMDDLTYILEEYYLWFHELF